MSDDRRDAAVEERVRAALGSLADTTSIAPDGWERIEFRAARRRRRRLVGWSVGGPAVALIAVALLLAMLPAGDSNDPSVTAGPAGEALARYAPRGLENERLALRSIQLGGSSGAATSDGRVRVYGHRAADGISLDNLALVVTTTTPEAAGRLRALVPGALGQAQCEPAASCIGLPVTPMTLRGREMEVAVSSVRTSSGELGAAKVVWSEANGATIGVVTTWLRSQYPNGDYLGADFRTVVEGVTATGGEAAATVLPAGFTEIHQGSWPPTPSTLSPDVVLQLWSTEGGGSAPSQFTLEVHQGAGVSLDSRAWITPDAVATTMDDRPALYSAGEDSFTWSPRDGVVLAVVATEQPLDRLRFLAESVTPVTEDVWIELIGGETVSPPPLAASDAPPDSGSLVASGEVEAKQWTVHYRNDQGQCLELRYEDGSLSGQCDVALAGDRELGPPVLLGDPYGDAQAGYAFLVASAGGGVESVEVISPVGPSKIVKVAARATGAPGRFVVVPVAPGTAYPTALVAVDGEGRILDQQPVRLPE